MPRSSGWEGTNGSRRVQQNRASGKADFGASKVLVTTTVIHVLSASRRFSLVFPT